MARLLAVFMVVLPMIPAAIDTTPDYGAFVTGLEIMTFTALITVSVFLVVGFIRRKLGE